jgi:hypothetical protein
MASAVSAELSHAAYHRPIHGGHDPTPVKQPSQKTQHIITQVPRSPSISQRPVPHQVSQKDSESIVHDSLEYRPPAPARPPNTLLDFLEQSVPIEKSQLATESHQKQAVASNLPSTQPLVIAQSSIEAPPPDHPSSEDHPIEQDSIQLPPPQSLPSEDKTTPQDPDKNQPPIFSQEHAVPANQTRANSSAPTRPDDNEEIQDCITVRPQPVTPPAKPDATRVSNSPAQVPSDLRQVEDLCSATPPRRIASPNLNVPAANGPTTPIMPPKASKPKASTSASQKRKSATTTSKKSSKPAPPVPNIINQGETSAAASLRQMKAGGNSQTNTTKQVLEAMPEAISGTRGSQKNPARPSQAATSKSATNKPTTNKPAAKPGPKLPIEKPSRRTEVPEGYGEYDLPPDPDVAESPAEPQDPARDKAIKTKPTKTTAASNKNAKTKSKNQAAKAPDTDEDDNDKDYSAPKTNKSKGGTATRASTRAQTKEIAKNNGLNVATQHTAQSDALKTKKRAPPKPVPSNPEGIEDFEDGVTHINSDGAGKPRPATQAQPVKPPVVNTTKPPSVNTTKPPSVNTTKPPSVKAAHPPALESAKAPAVGMDETVKPRRGTDRQTQLFNAISSPIQ